MANASYLKIFSFTFSLNLVGRKIPDSVSNYLPSCLSKLDSLSFTFKEARKGFFGCYSVCETMKDTKDG